LPLFIKRSPTAATGSTPISKFLEKKNTASGPAPEVKIDGVPVTQQNIPGVSLPPGTVMDRLEAGEEPVSFQTQRPNVNFGKFEEIIISAISWQNEVPPEIILMRFYSSYSAARQANNEYEIVLNFRAFKNSKDFGQIIFQEFVIQSCLIGDLIIPGFMGVMFDPTAWKKRGAWLKAEWRGLTRGSVDISKEVNAYTKAITFDSMTHDIMCRRLTGMSYNAVCYILAREKKLRDRLGLVSAEDENNNGEPVYSNRARDNESIEELKDSVQELTEMIAGMGRVS
jgi:capsid protein